jgi:hypothetical protein
MPKNIAAFTAVTYPYQPYLSINREDDGSVSIHVRGEPDASGKCDDGKTVKLSAEQWSAVAMDIITEYLNHA